MSRQIKFRVWNNYTNAWMYQFAQDICKSFGEPNQSLKVKPPFVYQQFTGLTDEKGTEIYEGDILQSNLRGDKEPIIFHSGSFYLAGWSLSSLVSPSIPETLHGYKVVGNIMENPDLL